MTIEFPRRITCSNRQQEWRDELLKTGTHGKGGQKLEFAELEVMAGTTCLHAIGTLAETGELFPLPKMIVFCAFTFAPEAAKDTDALEGITSLKAQMNPDLPTEVFKQDRSSNQSFWLIGQPAVALSQTADAK